MRNLEMNKQSRHATVEERCVTQPVKKEVMRVKEISIRDYLLIQWKILRNLLKNNKENY